MISVRSDGPWLPVKRVIELFVLMGCELRTGDHEICDPDGEWYTPRYLYSPETTDFVSLGDLEDDEQLSPFELANWERRLGMTIPKGDH